MSYKIHRAAQRGVAEHGWLHARFSFSFAEYRDLSRMGFGVLRVLNNDIIEPNGGFEMHPHNDMEIITYILRGALEHRDSHGNHGIINAGELQYMSAGSGVYHSEKNPSKTEPTELFQIWIYPNVKGAKPLYEQRSIKLLEAAAEWQLLVSGDTRQNSIQIRQNAFIWVAKLQKGQSVALHASDSELGRMIMVVHGSIAIGDEQLDARDEMQILGDESYRVEALSDAEVMLFEVPHLR